MCISYFSKRVTVHRNLGHTVYSMYVCMHACMHVCYESQPKAWAEYRYKRSEAKLVWGVWGGGSDLAAFWEGEAGACLGRAQKNEAPLPSFLRLKEKLHFGHFWLFSDVFLTFFIGCQKPKHCHLQCFWAFGMEKVLFATC